MCPDVCRCWFYVTSNYITRHGCAAVRSPAVRHPKFGIPAGGFSHWGARQASEPPRATRSQPESSPDSLTSIIFFRQNIFYQKSLSQVEPEEWLRFNLILWAHWQNMFAECSDDTNEAHETLQTNFLRGKKEKKIVKKIVKKMFQNLSKPNRDKKIGRAARKNPQICSERAGGFGGLTGCFYRVSRTFRLHCARF